MAGNSDATGKRVRKTLLNNRSKQTPLYQQWKAGNPVTPPGTPAAQTAYGAATAAYQQGLAGVQAGLQAGVGQAKATFMQARSAAKMTAIGGIAAQEGDALQRGILGSSVDLANRAGIVQQKAADVSAAASTKSNTLAALRANAIQSVGGLSTDLAAAQSSLALSQQQQASDAYSQNLFDLLTQNLQSGGGRGRARDILAAKNNKGQGAGTYYQRVQQFIQAGLDPSVAAKLANYRP